MTATALPADRIPVIVGVGEIVDRPKDIAEGLEPLALLEQAIRRAENDAGAKLVQDIGSSTSWANGVHGSCTPARSALVAVD
ncbi:MAG: hypothetical protein ACK495_29160, partial [Bradyrhizobium sp.]